MSESGEKQFDPTPSRLVKAKHEGDIPRASELGASLALAAGTLATFAIIPPLGMQFRAALVMASNSQLAAAPNAQRLVLAPTARGPLVLFAACVSLLMLCFVPMIASAIAGAAASLAQSGGFTCITPVFKLDRIDPFSGTKRLLSRQTLAQCGRAVAAFSIAVCASLAGLMPLIGITFQGGSIVALASVAWRAVLQSIFVACGIGLLFAFLEYGAARNAWLKRLRLSFDEYKRSIKEQDGDAHLRSRRRSFHRALARSDLRHVRKAAFIVCNPTHIAIALAYKPPDEPVPRVLVRAANDLAMRVRDIATEHNIPLVENIELARSLYADATTGLPIPHVHYLAVAEVVAALQKQKKWNK